MCDRPTFRKTSGFLAILIAAAFLLMVLTACDLVVGINSGRLLIHLDADTDGRTLTPDLDLEVTSYDISGSGPGGVSFSVTGINVDTHTETALVPGAWTVVATGKNAGGIAIVRSPEMPVTIVAGQTASVSLDCVPMAGEGSFSLSLTWPENIIGTASLEGRLVPDSFEGDAIPLSFTVNGRTASCEVPELQNGYYMLSIKLKDASRSNYLAWAWNESVLVYKDNETSVVWTLEVGDVDLPESGGVTLRLSSDSRMPIAITLSGTVEELPVGQFFTVTAVGNPVPDSWAWYLDGDRLEGQTQSSVSLGQDLALNTIHSLVAVGRKGAVAGSAGIRFKVVRSVLTLAGSGSTGYGDGTGTEFDVMFNSPADVACAADGTIYVADTFNHRIRKVTAAGVVTTFAGSGTLGFLDGSATEAQFAYPVALDFDSKGNLYVVDRQNQRIRKITPAGMVTTFAGSGEEGTANGEGSIASFYYPMGIAIATDDSVFIADNYNQKIRKITPEGLVSTFAGDGVGGNTDGPAANARFSGPHGLAFDSAGNLYVVESVGHKIRKITPNGIVSTFAGSGTFAYEDGQGTAASFSVPIGIAIDKFDRLFISDGCNRRIRLITPSGLVSTFAGSGDDGFLDGNIGIARFRNPSGLALGEDGILYVADEQNNRIRKIIY